MTSSKREAYRVQYSWLTPVTAAARALAFCDGRISSRIRKTDKLSAKRQTTKRLVHPSSFDSHNTKKRTRSFLQRNEP